MANSILKQPSRMAVREYQPGDISTAISEGVSSRLEREEKKAKEIDYLHLLKTYGLAGMAQLGGQEFAKAVVTPAIKGLKAVGQDLFVTPQATKMATWLASDNPSALNNHHNALLRDYNGKVALEKTWADKGLTVNQGIEELVVAQVDRENRARWVKRQLEAGKTDVSTDKIPETAWKAAALDIARRKSVWLDPDFGGVGTPAEFDIQQLVDPSSTTSLVELQQAGHKAFMSAVQNIPGGADNLKNFTGKLALVGLPSNTAQKFQMTLENLVSETSQEDQMKIVLNSAINPDAIKAHRDPSTGELVEGMYDVTRTVDSGTGESEKITTTEELNREMRYLMGVGKSIKKASDYSQFMNSNNTTAMVQSAMKTQDLTDIMRTLATESVQSDKIDMEISETGTITYTNTRSLETTHAGEKNIVSEEEEILHTSDDKSGVRWAIKLQRGAKTNLNTKLAELLSEDGRQFYMDTILEQRKQSNEWKNFLTDGDGQVLSVFSSNLNMDQYNYLGSLIDKTFNMEGGRFGKARSTQTNESFKTFMKLFTDSFQDMQKIEKAVMDSTKSIKNGIGELYDNRWLLTDGNFDINKYFNASGSIKDNAIPPSELQNATKFFGESKDKVTNILKAHMRDLRDNVIGKKEAIRGLQDAMESVQYLFRRFNIVTEGDISALSPSDKGSAVQTGVGSQYTVVPTDQKVEPSTDDAPVVENLTNPYDTSSLTLKSRPDGLPAGSILAPKGGNVSFDTLRKRIRQMQGRP